jgi:hypothetical protein
LCCNFMVKCSIVCCCFVPFFVAGPNKNSIMLLTHTCFVRIFAHAGSYTPTYL